MTAQLLSPQPPTSLKEAPFDVPSSVSRTTPFTYRVVRDEATQATVMQMSVTRDILPPDYERVDSFIPRLQEASEGIAEARIETTSWEEYGSIGTRMEVVGWVPLTDEQASLVQHAKEREVAVVESRKAQAARIQLKRLQAEHPELFN